MKRFKITDETILAQSWYEQAHSQTLDTLTGFINHLMNDYEHNYDTVCHAVGACAMAAIHAANKTEQGGITGFQSVSIMWEIVREMRYKDNRTTLMIQNFDNMLYPQYRGMFEKTMSRAVWKRMQQTAKELLEEKSDCSSPYVIEHWQTIVDGVVPFGYEVEE